MEVEGLKPASEPPTGGSRPQGVDNPALADQLAETRAQLRAATAKQRTAGDRRQRRGLDDLRAATEPATKPADPLQPDPQPPTNVAPEEPEHHAPPAA